MVTGGNSPPAVRVEDTAPTSGGHDGCDPAAEGEPHERSSCAGSLPDGLGGEPAQDDFEARVERLSALRILR
jgi:hypothetical protein